MPAAPLTDSHARLQKPALAPRRASISVAYAREKAGVPIAPRPALTEQLSSLRRTFDERLVALEAGLADPDGTPALESLVLNLVRTATDEAEAAAREAGLRAQRGAEAMLATAMAETQAVHVQLDAERAKAASLRAELASLKDQITA